MKRYPFARSLGVFFVLALLIGAGTWNYWSMYTTADDIERDVNRLEALLAETEAAFLESEPETIRATSERLDQHVTELQTRMRWDPLMNVARPLPGVGGQVSAAREFADMASATAAIGIEVASIAEAAERLQNNQGEGGPLTESLIAFLDEIADPVNRLDSETDRLLAHRYSIGDRALLPPLARSRDRIDGRLPELVNTAERLALARDVLPGLLGFEDERRYLVLLLNDGQLLPGGGLVTAAGTLVIDRGVPSPVEFVDSTGWLSSWENRGGDYIEPPGPLDRYLLRGYSWNLLVSNWSPDFPTWSQQALEFYELVHGQQDVDGVIALDLTVLERLLALTGPQDLEVEEEGVVQFTEENAILELQALTREAHEPGDDRKSVIGDLADVMLRELLSLPADDLTEAAASVLDLGRERSWQMLSFHPAEQTLLRDLRFDGAMNDAQGDYLQINEASVRSTKLNLVIQPEGRYEIDVDELGNAHHRLELHYANTLPEWSEGKDPELVRRLMLRGLYGGYLRVFTPESVVSPRASRDGDVLGVEDVGSDGGQSWWGVHFTVPSGETTELVLEWATPLATPESDRYELFIQKQPGASSICLDVEVTRGGTPAQQLHIDGGNIDGSGRVCVSSDVQVEAAF